MKRHYKRCVIIGGAAINNYEYIKKTLHTDDFYIFCDCGLNHHTALGIMPNLIIGDFDSYNEKELDSYSVETIHLPTEKDDTDTVYAAKEGLKRGFTDFLLLGTIGQRFDHSIANISILLMLYKTKAHALLIDDYSEMQIVGSQPVFVAPSFTFFSLTAVFGSVKGVSIKDAKYTLDNAELHAEYQYAVSNEPIGKTVTITVKEGCVLLIKVF